MDRYNDILSEVNSVFHRVFNDDSIVIRPETTADMISGWDSLSHMILISEIEKQFDCEFDFSDVMGFQNVGDMIMTILNKTAT
jgi:acyl carrier protein